MKAQLTKNQKYKATVKLTFGESLVASNDYIKSLLLKEGFVDVVVEGKGMDRTATGTWPKENEMREVPGQIKKVELL